MQLSGEQTRFFHLNGFLAITEPVTDADELAWMRMAYDRMFTERAGRERGDQFDLAGSDEEGKEAALPQILNPARYAPELENGKYLAVISEITRQLFGPEANAGIAHAIFKPAGVGAATPWHQDEAYWDPAFQYQNASIWMPLQEATVENGCLWFVPGSHEWPILEHRPIGGNVKVHGLEMVNLDWVKSAVACPLPPGGITIHRNRTAHYAGANTSAVPRRRASKPAVSGSALVSVERGEAHRPRRAGKGRRSLVFLNFAQFSIIQAIIRVLRGDSADTLQSWLDCVAFSGVSPSTEAAVLTQGRSTPLAAGGC